MAAEVPVSDVLCEAMEYLSKLGSNLRTRSENLKEKKIRKDKLKNTHAVQKAANKVLLICELSKKSLENVESGVRRILSLVDASQASTSIGGKTSRSNKISETKPHQYFEYQSHKLRISKKVPVKHFMTVKVLARNMPMSMQEKYPVYYDCKLYRLRRRKTLEKLEKSKKNQKHNSVGTDDDDAQEEHNTDQEQERLKNDKSSELIKSDSEHVTKIKSDNPYAKEIGHTHEKRRMSNECSKSIKNSRRDSLNSEKYAAKEADKQNSEEKTRHHDEKDDIRSGQELIQDSQSSRKNHRKENVEHSDDKDAAKTKKKYLRDTSPSENEYKNGKDKNIKKHYEIKKKKYRHIRHAEDSSDSCDEKSQERRKDIKEYEVNLISDEENTTCIDDKSCSPISKKSEKISKESHETPSVDDGSTEQPVKECNYNERPDEEHENTSEIASVNPDANVTKISNEQNDNNENPQEDKKPQIKCVNINKLLKPNIVEKIEPKPIEINKSLKEHQKKTDSCEKQNSADKHGNDSDTDKMFKKRKEEEYWIQKRSEVRAFKPKKIVINVNRLPELSKEFLLMHKLKRITKNDSVVCEATDQMVDNNDKVVNYNKNEAENVKNALLHDSDSDDKHPSSKHSTIEVERLKDASLIESDSDNQENECNHRSPIRGEHSSEINCDISNLSKDLGAETKKAKDTLLNESDSDSQNIAASSRTIDNNSVIKHALLNDSDSDNSVIKDDNDQVDVNYDKSSDNKSINDAEKFKNALLNDSDSDENQNKQGNGSQKLDDDNDKVNNEPNISSEKDEQNKTSKLNVENLLPDNESKSNDKNKSLDEELVPAKSSDKIKSSLLNSSDDSQKTPEYDRKKRKLSSTPQSKRKRVMESMKAKKVLLRYSSSSDEEQLKNEQLKGRKHSLLKGSSDEENYLTKKHHKRRRKKSRITSSSSSAEEIPKVKKKGCDSNSESAAGKQIETNKEGHNSPDEKAAKELENINQVDGTMDEHSNSSSSKMVRSKAKPGNSSNQSSDSQDANDKDVDRLTNLNCLEKPHRRRDSSSTDNTQDTKSTRKNKIIKANLIAEDLLLEESSDAASDEAGDDEDGEELPPVSVMDFNNGIGHITKDDLLGESDSSISQNEKDKSSEEVQEMDDSEEEKNVKLKRRKANAISSDSEVGLPRKKDRDVKQSDFEDEDTEEEGSDAKRSKRKKKGSDSDASAASSSNDGSKKKRRRIKQLDSEVSDSDGEAEGRNKHGRKNIRKVMGKNQLEEATKKAAREEKERIARIAERQKLYNNLEFDETGKPDEVVLEKVVLDFDPETKEPLIEVDRGLVKKLKPHQANGIKFMWDACFESVKRIKKDKGSGCILAHCMGLGKTLQVISLTHTLLIHGSLTGVNRVLVVCPLSTVLNWVNEFRMWLKHAETEFDVDVYELSRYKQNSERAYQLSQWIDGGGVCVLGYEMFRNLSADNSKKYKKKMLKNFQEALVDPGPDLVVCDEGHLLKNEKTSLSQSMNRVKTRRRIVLTGTPLQNNLKEYYCMVQFVKPNLLGKYNEYLNRFVNPITNGQYTDSTEHDIRVMKRRSHVLHKMLDGAVQRRDYGVLAPFLPPKHEYVLFITLSEVQVKLYQFYLDNYSRRPLAGKSSGFLFPDFQSLQRIWTHPLVLKYNSERYEIMQQKKREREEDDSEGSLVDFIDDDSTPDETSTEESSDDLSDASDDSRKKIKKKKAAKKSKSKDAKASTRRGTRANPVEIDDDDVDNSEVIEVKNENPTEWWIKLVEEEELDDMRNSHKLVLLFDILRQCETIGDKLLVFSQSLYSLDLIEHFLGKVDEATQEGRIDEKLGGHVGSWSPGVDYFRLDGSTSCENRSIWCKNFNREDNPRARLFLISTRAGGLGINLVAANRVVIFDVSWNPSHDVQSIFRVYRFGQKKPCYVYRFLAMGTMEEKIYERQVTKQAISKRVIDEQQIDRHYAENDLAELYNFEPTPEAPREVPALPKDRLFAEMLREHEKQIYKYHEHDSLLENKEEETLTEEERKAAWEDFENEKNKPPPAPFPSVWPMHNGMMPGLLQQQQLAYAALAGMLRKDMPNINENQIRDMLPIIYNSNPAMFGGYDYGLMQKMSEIYKYAQPGMMNPAMMSPVMNPAAGSGMGGASGLQYEPPWQRQHQQQQQLRLQQLMQQQNQMGAKYYAGGLGSRDPVAMALQQQRAREIMLGGGGGGGAAAGVGAAAAAAGAGAGRPRGRPPTAPRPLPIQAAAQDVVNLDSD